MEIEDCKYYICMTNAEKISISNFEEMMIMLEDMVRRVTDCKENSYKEEICKWMNSYIDEMHGALKPRIMEI